MSLPEPGPSQISTGLPRRTIYRGKKMDLALQQVRLADGSVAERELVVHRGAVVMIPLLDNDHVCLITNDRYSVGQTLIELPAGTIDPNEPPIVTAARELEEETGFIAGRIDPIAEWFVSPGVLNERMYLYVCRDLKPGNRDLQPDEQLTNLIVPWQDCINTLLSNPGLIQDAKTMLALLLWDRLRHTFP